MEGLGHRAFLSCDYAIINPMQVSSSHYEDIEVVCVLPTGWDRHRRLMPLLVELRGLPEEKRLALLERADWWDHDHDMTFFSALLTCPVDAARLASHLRQQMSLLLPGTGKAWLRFHDPRVFRHLCWLLTARQMTRLMGPVRMWTWYEPLAQRWHSWRKPDTSSQPPSTVMELTDMQCNVLEQFDALNACLRDIFIKTGIPPAEEIVSPLADALVEAASLGLRDIADKYLYAQQRMAHHTGSEFQKT